MLFLQIILISISILMLSIIVTNQMRQELIDNELVQMISIQLIGEIKLSHQYVLYSFN